MVDYGVTSTGFVKKTVNAIIADMEEKARGEFGDDIDLNPTSPLKHFIEIVALEEANLWDMLEDLYYSPFVEFATGEHLDRVVALLGLTRQAAAQSTGTQSFTAIEALTVPSGTIVQTDTGIEYSTDADLVFAGAGSDTIGITAVLPGTDSNVAADTLTTLKEPITGISSTTNAGAIANGSNAEADSNLRARAKAYSSTIGKGTVASIINAVMNVTGVISVSASEDFDLHKLTLTVAGVSYPNASVDAAIEDTRPAGIEVVWQNPSFVDIYCDPTVDVTGDAPVDAATRIRDAIVAYINSLDVGDDVIYTKLYEVIYDEDDAETEEWIVDVTTLLVDTVDPPTGTSNIVITSSQKAQTVAGNVEVTLT